jgi:hypothetical protein
MPDNVPLTTDEEVTLRRVAYGLSEERAMRRDDLIRLRQLHLIEDGKDGPRLTTAGKQRFDMLPKGTSLDRIGQTGDELKTMARRLREYRR